MQQYKIAVLGGTGNLGLGLVTRWLAAGFAVTIGSRDAARAQEAAERARGSFPKALVAGLDNRAAAQAADIIVLAIPFSAHASVLAEIREATQGKIVVDTTVPLAPPDVSKVRLPEGQAAALRTQQALGSGARVVAAFHHVAAAKLMDPKAAIDCDVLVCGDDASARATVAALVEAAGLVAVEAGPLANAVALESLTPVLIWMNKNRKAKGAGLRITGRTAPATG